MDIASGPVVKQAESEDMLPSLSQGHWGTLDSLSAEKRRRAQRRHLIARKAAVACMESVIAAQLSSFRGNAIVERIVPQMRASTRPLFFDRAKREAPSAQRRLSWLPQDFPLPHGESGRKIRIAEATVISIRADSCGDGI
jgi:hypothetical protein